MTFLCSDRALGRMGSQPHPWPCKDFSLSGYRYYCCACQLPHQPEPRTWFVHSLQKAPRCLLLSSPNQSLYMFSWQFLRLDFQQVWARLKYDYIRASVSAAVLSDSRLKNQSLKTGLFQDGIEEHRLKPRALRQCSHWILTEPDLCRAASPQRAK